MFQFTAIDDCTRLRVLKIYDSCTQATAIRFVNDVVRRLPFRVHVIQTDKGAEFQSFASEVVERSLISGDEALELVAAEVSASAVFIVRTRDSEAALCCVLARPPFCSYRPDEVELRPMTRIVWSALLTVVLLEASPTDAFAQSTVCLSIRRGESASQAARRVTGNGQNAYQPWFQIMNLSSRFIPKSQYNRVRAGWRACVIDLAVGSLTSNTHRVEASGAADVPDAPNGSRVSTALAAPTALARAGAGNGMQSAASGIARRLGVDPTMLWLFTALVASWSGWRIVDGYLAQGKTTAIIVQHFVQRFVDEFERPLVRDGGGERPVRSRLRFGLRRGRFSICLAPGRRRRYPNLSDHKKNVEYDVARVIHVLDDHSFVSRAPYTDADWIVVPFQFTAGPRQSGIT